MATSEPELQLGLAKVADPDVDAFMAYAAIVPEYCRLEGLLVKAVAAGENAAVAERAWDVLRAEGAVVEEPAEDDEDEGAEGLAEKVGLALQLDEKAGMRAFGAEEGDGGVLDLT